MTPAHARTSCRRQIAAHGETVTLRRVNASPTPPTDIIVRARVTGYKPDPVVGAIIQGDRKLVVLAEDAATFPLPFRARFDKAIVRGSELTIQEVDDSTRRVAGEIIAYEIRAAG